MNDTLCMVMAGGRGARLGPLTCHRAKPAAPFGGRYRIIDFVLSNFLNSGYRKIYVLTQYKSSSLIKHLSRNWHLGGTCRDFLEVAPAQMRLGEHWYRGTADAVFQNLNLIHDERSQHVAIFSGDHIYKFAIDQMERAHREMDADLTIATFPVPVADAHRFGVLSVNQQRQVTAFQEKPKENPLTLADNSTHSLVSMGNYFFKTDVLVDALHQLNAGGDARFDFGRDVIPLLLSSGAKVCAYDFSQNLIPGEPKEARAYWRDVGTLDSYFDAHMDLRSNVPSLNMYNRSWRIHSAQRDYPPARFVRDPDRPSGQVVDSLICEGSIISGAHLDRSLIGYDCFIHGGARLTEVVTMSGCNIGLDAQLYRVLLDKNCSIAAGAQIGSDPAQDRGRFPFITPNGVVVLPKGTHVPARGPLELAQDVAELLLSETFTREALEALSEPCVISRGRFRHSYTSAGPRYSQYRGGDLSAFRPGQAPAEQALARGLESQQYTDKS